MIFLKSALRRNCPTVFAIFKLVEIALTVERCIRYPKKQRTILIIKTKHALTNGTYIDCSPRIKTE